MTETTERLTYSNPRQFAEFSDWPFGRQRVRCAFNVETDRQGRERVARVTENKTRTGWNKPKKTTYANRARIVDGSDGKTYLLLETKYGFIEVRKANMQEEHETVHGDTDPARYASLLALIQQS